MDIEQLMAGASEEVRSAAAAHHASFKRLRRSEEQVARWTQEHLLAKRQFEVTDADFKAVMERYKGGTVAPDPKVEL